MRPSNLRDHPERLRILNEVHARPADIVECPSIVRRVAVLLPRRPDATERAQRAFLEWCEAASVPQPAPHCRQHRFKTGGRRVTWELHTEFVTLTWTEAQGDSEQWPAGIGLEAIGEGEVMVATCVESIPAFEPGQQDRFSGNSFCASTVEGGAGIATDLMAGSDGFTRYVVAVGDLAPFPQAVLIRKLLEIETYRSLALLGLPLAHAISLDLNELEAGLTSVVEAMAESTRAVEDQDSLAALHRLSVQAGRLGERTAYRFAASAAYGKLMARRLESLDEVALPDASTLRQYLSHRSEPALNTCLAVEKRQAALSEKIHRATELLNTRIGLKIEAQNQSVLTSIADTAASQFRLQRTVEGLSVIAISYYFLGVMGYILTGVGEIAHFSKPLILAGAAPIVVVTTWVALRMAELRSGRTAIGLKRPPKL